MKTNNDSHSKGATCLLMENNSSLVLDKTQQPLCPESAINSWMQGPGPGGLAFCWVISETMLPASLICDMMDFTI